MYVYIVLNLVISGIPSILVLELLQKWLKSSTVLNLVISGIPSIQSPANSPNLREKRFKPCYKWNTFNTKLATNGKQPLNQVLNLVISGIPSIRKETSIIHKDTNEVLNLVISGIPSIPLICIRILILWQIDSLFRGQQHLTKIEKSQYFFIFCIKYLASFFYFFEKNEQFSF